MAGTQQKGAQCRGKLFLRIWLFSQNTTGAGAQKDMCDQISILNHYFDYNVEQIGNCKEEVVKMTRSKWKILMRQYLSTLNARAREKEVSKMTPTFLTCVKGWMMTPFSFLFFF